MERGMCARATAAGVALFFGLGAVSAAQDKPVREFLKDAGKIWTAPFRLKEKDVAPLVVLTAATAFLIAADEGLRDGVQDFAGARPWVGEAASAVTAMGGPGAWAAAGAFFGAGLLFRDAKARETGALAMSAMLQTFLVDNFLKGLTGRQRPFYADGEDHWSGPVGFVRRFDAGAAGGYVSFPSGHTATAFALATVVAMQYRRETWVPVLAYAVAGSVGLSRMALDRHWASDVLVGAVLGHVVARLVVRNHERRRRIVPVVACTGRGVALGIFWDPGPFDR
jgi:membrane-associated phospholipid phosphatase